MANNLDKVMDLLDDIKGDIKEGQYLEMCRELKSLNKNFSKLYKLKYIHQYHESKFKDVNNPAHTLIVSKIKTRIVKFDEEWNENMIKTFIQNVGKLERIQSISFMGGRDDLPLIVQTFSFGEWIRSNPEDEDDEETTLIKYDEVIPLAIEEL